jgi:hypothetical protein
VRLFPSFGNRSFQFDREFNEVTDKFKGHEVSEHVAIRVTIATINLVAKCGHGLRVRVREELKPAILAVNQLIIVVMEVLPKPIILKNGGAINLIYGI